MPPSLLLVPHAQQKLIRLCLSREGVREPPHVVRKRSLVPQELHVRTVHPHATLLAFGDVLLAVERGEAPLLRDDDLLATWELVLAAAEGLDGVGAV